MPHKHPANEGDYLKHVVLEELLTQVVSLPSVQHVRYVDPYSGEGLYPRKNLSQYNATEPPAKASIWKSQQSHPDYYLGSPLIALQTLQRLGQAFSLRLSDSHRKTIEKLDQAIKGGVPGYVPGQVLPSESVQVLKFTGENLAPLLGTQPSTVNVVLLDPTNPGEYGTVIDNSIAACHDSKSNAIMMCWGLHSWEWPTSITNPPSQSVKYSEGRYPSVIHLLCLGSLRQQLDDAVRVAIQGW